VDHRRPAGHEGGPADRRDEASRLAVLRNRNLIAAACPCGRSIRVTASTLAEASITCQACGGDFRAKTA
jgi:hypothetical protein